MLMLGLEYKIEIIHLFEVIGLLKSELGRRYWPTFSTLFTAFKNKKEI
jgi:hypothetical protein